MIIEKIDMANFDLVEVKSTNGCMPTPHCKIHGAMNKITVNEDGGGIWRCLSEHSFKRVKVGNAIGKKENDCSCRAGCKQIR